MSNIFDKLIPIFRNVFDDDELIINETTNAEDIDEWDSLSHIRLIVSHEIEFGVKFKTTEISDLRNVGDFIDLLKSKLD